MQISSNQIAQVNQQIQALLNANNFYGKKLKEAGVSQHSVRRRFRKSSIF